jgi:hypothetical protein
VTGCSTGEEAYSLAIILKEASETIKPAGNFKIQIFASDLDKDAVVKARIGMYPSNIAADVSPQRLQRFFEKDDRGYRIKREIRELIVFAPHNVIMDPPFTKLDILVCRNLLIYMEQELQKKLLSLNPLGQVITFLNRLTTNPGFSVSFQKGYAPNLLIFHLRLVMLLYPFRMVWMSRKHLLNQNLTCR